MLRRVDLLQSTILVVDDDPVFVGLVARGLKQAGYSNYTSLSDPISALELLAEMDVDLLLLDQCMPEMSGLEVLQQIAEMPLGRRPAVLMVSGSTQLELPVQALSQGAWDLVSKPVDINSLLLRIRNLLDIKNYQKQLESENQMLLQALELQKRLKGQEFSLADRVSGMPNRTIFMDRLQQALLRSVRLAGGVGILRLEYVGDERQQDQRWEQQMLSAMGEIVGHNTMMRDTEYSWLVLLDLLNEPGDVEPVLELIKGDSSGVFAMLRSGVVLSWGGEKSAEQLLEAVERGQQELQVEGGVSLKGELYKAIFEKEGAEFELVWQPQVTSLSVQVVAAEVLLRWRSELLGDVSPARFVPLAEAEGWIGAISRLVVERSLQQYARWRDEQGIELSHFSVNLSANDLQDEEIVDYIAQMLQRYQVAPATFCVELTESELMNDLDRGQLILQQLKALGVKVALDDFGTGYSSLSYLRLFDLDILKLDRSFVLDLTENSASQSIIQALIVMAKMMELEVVIEGVESLQQCKALHRCGADLMQGYYYSQPLDEKAFAAYMQNIPGSRPEARLPQVAPIEWSSEEYGVGHHDIDGQHRMLFNIINQLVDAIEAGRGRERLPVVLRRMREYAEFHLLSEEIVLNEVQYPQRQQHHESHETIRRGIQQLLDYQATLHPVQAYQYLKEVWVEHIQHEDRAFSRFL